MLLTKVWSSTKADSHTKLNFGMKKKRSECTKPITHNTKYHQKDKNVDQNHESSRVHGQAISPWVHREPSAGFPLGKLVEQGRLYLGNER